MRHVWLGEIVGSTILLCLTGYYVIMVITIDNFCETFIHVIILYSSTIIFV